VSDVNLQLVREFFELNLFRVLTHWQHNLAGPNGWGPDDRTSVPEAGLQLFVENTHPASLPPELNFVLRPEDVQAIRRAVVEVRAWHADRFYPSVVQSNPILGQFAAEEALSFARHLFDTSDFTTILVISELPASREPRERAIQLLEGMGIGHILEYPTVLRVVLDKISPNGLYASQTLATLRLLKRYRLIRHQQLEFTFPNEATATMPPPNVETIEEPTGAEGQPWKEGED